MYSRENVHMTNIALDVSSNPLRFPFRSTGSRIQELKDSITYYCKNPITQELFDFLHDTGMENHNIKLVLHLFIMSFIYRDKSNNICGIICWTVSCNKMIVTYSFATSEELYNMMLTDIEEYSAAEGLTHINILWNIAGKFDIYHDLRDLEKTLLYKVCIAHNYIILDRSFETIVLIPGGI